MTPYNAASTATGVIDGSASGRVLVRGAEHLDFVQRLSTNHVLACDLGQGLRTVFCDPRGRIIVLAELCRIEADSTVLFVGPGQAQALIAWFERYHFSERLEWQDVSDVTEQIDIVGPEAARLCHEQFGIDVNVAARFGLLPPAAGLPGDGLRAMRIDAGPHAGVRLWGPDLAATRKVLADAGAVPVDAETHEILRIEWGQAGATELTEEHNPWEAGLHDAIHMNKGCYTGQEVIARLDTYQKIKQHLVGLRLAEPTPVGATVSVEDRDVGVVTSVGLSPTLGTIALAYVRTAHCQPGTSVQVDDHNGARVSGTLQALPLSVP